MLYAFGFDRYGVVISDIYFVDPNPMKGQESPEHGVRLELRVLDRGELRGSIYSAQPIGVDQPVWRVDLLESVDGKPGSFDRTHHHPAFTKWEPGPRKFVRELSADPLGWLGTQLSDLPAVLAQAKAEPHQCDAADAEQLRARVPEILDVVDRMLTGVRSGVLAVPPQDVDPDNARVGWL
ncbi:MAG TPA: hypothetical protein VGH27_12885 [Streptosporangiaceae bacterium]